MCNEKDKKEDATNFLRTEEVYGVMWEPKTRNRFICHMVDKEGKEVIPHYLIKRVTRPSFLIEREVTRPSFLIERETGKCIWKPIEIEVYDPIVPSAAQLFFLYAMETPNKKFDITIDVLGPVSDKVELWEITGARIVAVDFGELDWSACPSWNDSTKGKSKIDYMNMEWHYKGGETATIKAIIEYEKATLQY